MTGQGRPIVLSLISALGIFAGSSFIAVAENNPSLPRPQFDDAHLRDVYFVNRDHGVAVGDRGVIWLTRDGGRHWLLCNSGTTDGIESVHFTDSENGWACGGQTRPYTHTTSGVLLRTRDGGQTWEIVGGQMLPALTNVAFFNAAQGFAVGDSSAFFPGGIAFTDDGGRSWHPASMQGSSGWLTGDFVDPQTGAVAGFRGTLAAVEQRRLAKSAPPSDLPGDLKEITLTKNGRGWCVGDGGIVLTTADHGQSWHAPEGALPRDVDGTFDWRAVAAHGEKCWIAGTPGTRVLSTSDGGRTWHSFATGQSLPLYGLHFVDDRHGWAVGALGTILATRDGGQTWTPGHGGGRRCAVLAVHGGADRVPLELIALLAGNDGYRTAVNVLFQPQGFSPSESNHDLPRRTHQAVTHVGGAGAETAWRFPLEQPDLDLPAERLIDVWQEVEDALAIRSGRNRNLALEQLDRYVVRQIRTWRPDVVVTDHSSFRGEDPLAHLVNQIVIRAVARAADPSTYANLGGLDAWEAKKVVALLPEDRPATINVSTAQFAPRLGRSLADATTIPRGLISDRFVPSPATLRFRVDVDRLPQDQGKHDVLSGIDLKPGSDARRELSQANDPATIEQLRRATQKNQLLRTLVERSQANKRSTDHLIAQLGDLTDGLDALSAGSALFELAQHYRRAGQWNAAAETFTAQLERYPGHPLSEAALVWLIQYWSSREMAARGGAHLPFDIRRGGPLAQVLPADNRPGATELVGDPHATNQRNAHRYERASQLAQLVQQSFPSLYGEPAIGFPLAAVFRDAGDAPLAGRWLQITHTAGDGDAWQSCIAAERWLERPVGTAPKPLWICSKAGNRPRLDGKLDDEIWQTAARMPLGDPRRDETDRPTEAMLVYDSEFLYLAVRCPRAPGVPYSTSEAARRRDADLAGHDRIELFVDVDRDYATWYCLSADYQGMTHDSCWGSAASWNPTWYVAAGAMEQDWVIEAAVPLAELAAGPIAPNTTWAIGVQRIVPQMGIQSWTTPAGVEPRPEGFGLLRFE